ncbi:peptidase C1-like family protein [Sodiomyces alkalinus F11]|uniref:Cysteine proteinase 1, mitochondrial n=1 Tax=Sodiomyces alkalinus (strain CBS 110278 / VKM F-3762 / F11) TaxID=1314773 RepID=A0A3N2PLG1_SODAK|nr:peptidase C1-like family protein [Sodiomyces alkalinus F11]ROT35365.1 peptidase C1-like family protein [Sodiomyces alkalinus F11]
MSWLLISMGGKPSKPPPHVIMSAEVMTDETLHQGLDGVHIRNGHQESPESNQMNEKSACLARKPQSLSLPLVQSWQRRFLEEPKNRLALMALSVGDPRKALISAATIRADPHVFNVRIPLEGSPVTNQNASGRCWLFAATNVFRVALMKRYDLAAFELSQSYLFFWDKLEKANWFLEQVIDTAAHGYHLDSRLVQHLLAEPISDGGQWDMVSNLVSKYGLVPQSLYPDTWNAKNSSVLNRILRSQLREYAVVLRRLVEREKEKEKEDGREKEDEEDKATTASQAVTYAKARMLRAILGVLTVTLGPPPDPRAEFTWAYEDADGQAHELRTTPCVFSLAPCALHRATNMVSLVHDPRHPPLTRLTVDRLGNVVGGRPVTYVNVDMHTLKAACVASLRGGQPVFFGSDVGKFSSATFGMMDLDLFDCELGFGVGLRGLDKADRLRARESQLTHAMVLTGVHVDSQGGTVRWRVQNSWGERSGQKGWFVMSDAWMDEFVYQAVVDPLYLAKEVKDVLKKTPVVLPLWDPMGSLA